MTYLDLAGLVTTEGTSPASTSGKLLSAGLEVVHASLERVGAWGSNGHGGQSKEDGGSGDLGKLHDYDLFLFLKREEKMLLVCVERMLGGDY